jgi:hypothetical protein
MEVETNIRYQKLKTTQQASCLRTTSWGRSKLQKPGARTVLLSALPRD